MVLRRVWVIVLLMGMVWAQCPSGSMCTPCTDSQCSTCDTDVNTCDACNTGYYLDASSVCTACPDKCLSCSTNTYCDTCTPGYDRSSDSDGNQICVFYWWKWFLIVFGILIGVVLLGRLILMQVR